MIITHTKETAAFSFDFKLYALILFCMEFTRGAYLIAFLPTYAVNHLGYTVALIGVAVSVHYLADTIVKIFAGYLLDRFSSRWIMLGGLCVAFAGLWIMYHVQSPSALIAASAIFGIGLSPIWLVCLSNVKENNRASQMGLLYSLWLAGLGLGPVMTNFLLDKSYSLSFWFIVCFWIVGMGLTLAVKSANQLDKVAIPLRSQATMFWERLRSMGFLFPGMILQTMAASMLIPILSDFVSKQMGLSHTSYSFMLIAGGGTVILCLVPMGKLSDRWEGRWFMVFGFMTFACALFGATFISTFHAAIVLAMLLGLSYAAVLPAWNALLAQYVPQDQKGVGWGLFSCLEGIGIIAGPMIGGKLAVQFGDSMAVAMSALLFLSIAMFYLIVPILQSSAVHPSQSQ